MPTPITITTAAAQFASTTIECHCSIEAQTIVGPTTTMQVVPLPVALAPDLVATLCQMVAAHFNVPVADVSVAPGPTPTHAE